MNTIPWLYNHYDGWKRTFVRLLTGIGLLLTFPIALAAPELPDQASDRAKTVVGELQVFIADDHVNHRSQTHFVVREEKSGKRFELKFEGKPNPGLRAGQKISVSGLEGENNTLYLTADDSPQMLEANVQPAVAGEQRTLVIVGNFSDAAVQCSTEAIDATVFSGAQSANRLYQQTSDNLIEFNGLVTQAFDLGVAGTQSCDHSNWMNAAEAQAQAAGIPLADYPRKVFVFPEQNSCSWSGIGQVGGAQTVSVVFPCASSGVFAHELGHNLGMYHASTETSEYGDNTDIMGWASPTREINAPHQEQMGWKAQDKIVLVSSDATFDIAPLELSATQTGHPQILKIAKTDTNEFYYVSFRQPIDFDANISASLLQRLHIHRASGNGGRTHFIAALNAGESFDDSVNGISVRHVGWNSQYATAEVNLSGACSPVSPVVALSPSVQSAIAGAQLSYQLTVSNPNSDLCGASSYELTGALPVGWQHNFDSNVLTIAAGASAATTLSVVSAANAAAGNHALSVNVADVGHPNLSTATTTATYVVDVQCTRNTPELTISPAIQSGAPGELRSFAVSVSNVDSGACSASRFELTNEVPVDWSGSITAATLDLDPGETTNTILNVVSAAAAADGAHIVQINLRGNDSLHAVSDEATYTVVVPLSEPDPDPDTQSPSTPNGLVASSQRKAIRLSWQAATDNVAVSGYRVFRNGAMVGAVETTEYADRERYTTESTYYVIAVDAEGNSSTPSNSIVVQPGSKKPGGGKGRSKP